MKRRERGGYGTAPAMPESLGERIRAVRLRWGWTQARLAEAVHTNQKTLSAWERGVAQPTEAALGGLATLFGTSPKALTSGRGFRIPDEAPRQMGALLVAEPFARDLERLPPQPDGGLMAVDRRTGSQEPLTPRQVSALIRKTQAEGRPVWVVLG